MLTRRAFPTGVLLLVLTAACTADPPEKADAPPESPAAAATVSPRPTPTPEAAIKTVTQDLWQFRTPSGNIGCAITPEAATCELLEAAWAPEQPDTPCDGADWNGKAVTVDAQQTQVGICTTDTVIDADAEVLGYDTGVASGDLRCTSRHDGLTCEHVVSRRGFTVSRESLTLS